MSKTELKAYLATLKTFTLGKKAGIPVCQGVASDGVNLMTSDLDHYAIFNPDAPTAPAGVYDPFAFALLGNNGLSADLSQQKVANLSDFPEIAPKWQDGITLDPEDVDSIVEASNYVSSDDLRPALERVALKDGYIMATDGYIAYVKKTKGTYSNLGLCYFDQKTVSALKKLRKYSSTWLVCLSDDGRTLRLTDGRRFTILADVPDVPFPDMVGLLDKCNLYSSSMTFDFGSILNLADREHNVIEIDPLTGVIEFFGRVDTGVRAKFVGELLEHRSSDSRKVIMPMRADSAGNIKLNVSLLKQMTREKEITLLVNLNTSDMLELL